MWWSAGTTVFTGGNGVPAAIACKLPAAVSLPAVNHVVVTTMFTGGNWVPAAIACKWPAAVSLPAVNHVVVS